MHPSSRILAAALALCQSLIWICPNYCSTASKTADRKETRTLASHEHHHSDHGMVGTASIEEIAATATVSLRAMHCTDCGLAAPDVMVRPLEPLAVADGDPASVVHTDLLPLGSDSLRVYPSSRYFSTSGHFTPPHLIRLPLDV